MKDKLIIVLTLTTVFSLGCATFHVGMSVGEKDVEAQIAKHARTLPPGWRAIGGSATGSTVSALFACRGGV